MSAARRTFGALISHDSVCLVEYATERTGIRVVGEWIDNSPSASIDEALARLRALFVANDVRSGTLSLAVEQFGVFHHVAMLPGAGDDVLRPVIRREIQRVFGVTDPVFAFKRGAQQERREPNRADPKTAPRQVIVAGAPRDTIDALGHGFTEPRIDVEIATVVPKAIHSLYEVRDAGHEPTAVLVCLEGGPHLSFFLNGRLELAIDPPIALEGDRASIAVTLDQVERGAVYFRQQFRGATATRVLLAARAGEYDALAAEIEMRLGVQVSPLFAGTTSPEAVVAMGAVLEARSEEPLDLYPHLPTLSDRAQAFLRGPNLVAGAVAVAAVMAGIWALAQFATLGSTRREAETMRASIRSGLTAVAPMRDIAQRRADFARQVAFVRQSDDERSSLTTTLEAIAQEAPPGVRFDSLRVSRIASGWSAVVGGQATGATSAQSVRNLDTFVNSVRLRRGVSAASLDQFDYPASTDTTHGASAGVAVMFRLTFQIARGGPPAGAP